VAVLTSNNMRCDDELEARIRDNLGRFRANEQGIIGIDRRLWPSPWSMKATVPMSPGCRSMISGRRGPP
jgi:hypothetical protein